MKNFRFVSLFMCIILLFSTSTSFASSTTKYKMPSVSERKANIKQMVANEKSILYEAKLFYGYTPKYETKILANFEKSYNNLNEYERLKAILNRVYLSHISFVDYEMLNQIRESGNKDIDMLLSNLITSIKYLELIKKQPLTPQNAKLIEATLEKVNNKYYELFDVLIEDMDYNLKTKLLASSEDIKKSLLGTVESKTLGDKTSLSLVKVDFFGIIEKTIMLENYRKVDELAQNYYTKASLKKGLTQKENDSARDYAYKAIVNKDATNLILVPTQTEIWTSFIAEVASNSTIVFEYGKYIAFTPVLASIEKITTATANVTSTGNVGMVSGTYINVFNYNNSLIDQIMPRIY